MTRAAASRRAHADVRTAIPRRSRGSQHVMPHLVVERHRNLAVHGRNLAPLAARAQAMATIPRIGILESSPASAFPDRVDT